MTDLSRIPAAFIGHGSPMNTLEVNDFTRAWRELGHECVDITDWGISGL
jgi:4,5-DOPA dioxygenase extradiol